MQPGARIVITPEADAYACPLCGGCHPFESSVCGVNGGMIDAVDPAGDVDCFPVEWCQATSDGFASPLADRIVLARRRWHDSSP